MMLIAENIISLIWLVPIIGYVEMHWRLKYLPFNRYFKREPEIIADAPHRLNPGNKLPISILIKDAHWYPITLENIVIKIINSNGKETEITTEYNTYINEKWFVDNIEISTTEFSGEIKIYCTFNFEIRGNHKSVINHNVKTTEHFPLITIIDIEPLPGSELFWFGDLHHHSSYTEDFIEFGAPLESIKSAAKAIGLDFVAITDHSYDLDDKLDSWEETDPNLTKWKESRATITAMNNDSATLLIPSEEVSSRNNLGKNVHTLVLNHPDFIPGSGDSGEKPLRTKSEHSIKDILSMQTDNSIVIAAHPFYQFPFIQQLLLNRDKWHLDDCKQDGLTGLQILNGNFDTVFSNDIKLWIKLLLDGKKKYIFAGNDAHGSFNHYHQIYLAMISTTVNRNLLLGRCRTGVINLEEKSVHSIIKRLKNGNCIISDGPAIGAVITAGGKTYSYGDTVNSRSINIKIDYLSSNNFGSLREATVYKGIFGNNSETKLFNFNWNESIYNELIIKELEWNDKSGYIRFELKTSKNKYCLTNPIWIC